jgi:hypothetical protein
LTLFAITKGMKIFTMMLIRITGSQLHAAHVLVGLSREEVAERAGLCRHSIRSWENSSHAIPGAMCTHLYRAVDVLESQGRASTAMGSTCSAPPSTPNDSEGVANRHAGV